MLKNLLKKFLDFNYGNIINFAIRFSLITFFVTIIPFAFLKLFSASIRLTTIEFFVVLLSITIAFYLYRYKSQVVLTWVGFIKIGGLISLFNLVLFSVFTFIFKGLDQTGDQTAYTLLGIIYSVIAGIFFEKSPIKVKLKRILSIVLFVWALYNIITSFLNNDSESSLDTNGDGIKDSFDTNGDGMVDTIFIDSDGDGINDMVAMDANHDGIIDTIAADTDRDGTFDTAFLDRNENGQIDKII
jgi:hypothetical protein